MTNLGQDLQPVCTVPTVSCYRISQIAVVLQAEKLLLVYGLRCEFDLSQNMMEPIIYKKHLCEFTKSGLPTSTAHKVQLRLMWFILKGSVVFDLMTCCFWICVHSVRERWLSWRSQHWQLVSVRRFVSFTPDTQVCVRHVNIVYLSCSNKQPVQSDFFWGRCHWSCLVFDTSAVSPACYPSHMESCLHSSVSPPAPRLLERSVG